MCTREILIKMFSIHFFLVSGY